MPHSLTLRYSVVVGHYHNERVETREDVITDVVEAAKIVKCEPTWSAVRRRVVRINLGGSHKDVCMKVLFDGVEIVE